MEAPDFHLQNLAGGTHRLADLQGEKLTVIVFWATWSENSQKALRQMQALQQRYGGSGLAVIAINVDRQDVAESTLAGIKQVVASRQITIPVLLDQGLKVFNRYGVIAVPSLVVLDKDRVIRRELSGFPLMGSATLAQYLEATLENRPLSVKAADTGYQPDKKAVRLWNMGVSTLKSERSAGHAKAWFERAIAADPAFTLPYISLGELYYRQHNLAAAKEQFELVLRKKADSPVALSALGKILMDEGDLAGAEQKLTLAVQGDESYLPSYYLLGVLKGKQGDLAQALQWFARGEQMNPNEYKLFVYKGIMFEQRNDSVAATAAYRQALQLITGMQ
jgi:Flp pilus assembly protein TadD/peroxiredoxin